MKRTYRYFDLVTALFVTVLLISNLLSSAKIIDLGVSIGPIALIFDAGTLVFPVAYIFGDILTEVYGYKQSRRVIWFGFAATALMGFFVWLAGILPGESAWQGYAGQEAYNAILGGVSGLIVASLVAYWAGEFTNSFVLAKMKIATQGRWLWSRTIGSTLVGHNRVFPYRYSVRSFSTRITDVVDRDQLHSQSRYRNHFYTSHIDDRSYTKGC
jgi:queuosine precursor transporter